MGVYVSLGGASESHRLTPAASGEGGIWDACGGAWRVRRVARGGVPKGEVGVIDTLGGRLRVPLVHAWPGRKGGRQGRCGSGKVGVVYVLGWCPRVPPAHACSRWGRAGTVLLPVKRNLANQAEPTKLTGPRSNTGSDAWQPSTLLVLPTSPRMTAACKPAARAVIPTTAPSLPPSLSPSLPACLLHCLTIVDGINGLHERLVHRQVHLQHATVCSKLHCRRPTAPDSHTGTNA